MLDIKKNVSLAPFTTFKIGGPAKFFTEVNDQFDALEAYEFAREKQLEVFVLGGGSNVLISDKGFDGLVIHIVNKGIDIVWQDEDQILLKAASGEVWDQVVKFAVSNNWWGIENLSYIPGSTGAIAVQNVGAYGQEASRVIKSVTVFNRETHQILELNNPDCGFSYRKSIFNSTRKGRYIIFYVTLVLQKNGLPNLSYRDLKNRFVNKTPRIDEIRQAVIEIRDKKYPFPTKAKNGNAGSFFKNPALDENSLKNLEERIKDNFGNNFKQALRNKIFREGEESKIPAAFLIELCGLKDMRESGAKINHNQPLVIINESGRAAAKDVLILASKVVKTVYEKIGVRLEIEPELVGFSQKELDDIM